MTHVLIVEDEPALLRRFTDAVLAEPGFALCGAVSTVAAARALLDATPVDVVLIDLGLPDGHGSQVIRHAVARYPQCDVIVVTMFGDDANVTDCIAAGATGYLLKDALPQQLVAAIQEVREGGSPISPAIARRILQRIRTEGAPAETVAPAEALAPARPAAAVPPPSSLLSERETEILRLTSKGLSFKEVGEVLGISGHTVKTHIKRIYQKLAVHSRGEAVYEAGQLGLL
ncbi:response regulator transcription factor [Xenophilus arseniciresistens]|uniref:Response regulator transcription factor n=1 Tax=Xenophilus arseniciresistens TaxID=1283306 RepID=A0AAE3SXX6_9BURK|nr:response regulator transcription factor [Xenophilus arseniciresistens]MDA7414950.1 response regulator transcription factor [Xenophilus arseniciresistens]